MLIWGILNVTPDSFSDGGDFLAADAAIQHGRELLLSGADIIDIGGESTRPLGQVYGEGYESVSVQEELQRIIPVIEVLAKERAVISVDTTKAEVAHHALCAGATIVNDTSGGRSEELLRVVAEHKAQLVLMHNRGRGETTGQNIVYKDLFSEIKMELEQSIDAALSYGIDRSKIWIDPGFGFAKTPEQSIELHCNLSFFVKMGYSVLVGASRKSFLATIVRREGEELCAPQQRVGATIGSALYSLLAGVQGVRVHDVRQVKDAIQVFSDFNSKKGDLSWS